MYHHQDIALSLNSRDSRGSLISPKGAHLSDFTWRKYTRDNYPVHKEVAVLMQTCSPPPHYMRENNSLYLMHHCSLTHPPAALLFTRTGHVSFQWKPSWPQLSGRESEHPRGFIQHGYYVVLVALVKSSMITERLSTITPVWTICLPFTLSRAPQCKNDHTFLSPSYQSVTSTLQHANVTMTTSKGTAQ